MTSIFKSMWSRTRNSDRQSGNGVPLIPDTVMDYNEAEDNFTEVKLRPMTYAEAAMSLENVAPPSNIVAFVDSTHSSRSSPSNSRATSVAPVSTAPYQPRASKKVEINTEYDVDEFVSQRQRKRKGRR